MSLTTMKQVLEDNKINITPYFYSLNKWPLTSKLITLMGRTKKSNQSWVEETWRQEECFSELDHQSAKKQDSFKVYKKNENSSQCKIYKGKFSLGVASWSPLIHIEKEQEAQVKQGKLLCRANLVADGHPANKR